MYKRIMMIFIALTACVMTWAGIGVPMHQHPRLYVNAEDIPALRQRVQTPQGKAVLQRLETLSDQAADDKQIPEDKRDFRYYFQMKGLTSKVQLLALDYLLNGNTESADQAVSSVLDSLKNTSYPKKRDLSRANGVMLMVGAMVYDWCYDRLSDAQKQEFISNFKRIASCMECGYPINVVEDIAGHTGEWMIMRDILSAGVAIYDEYPQMYADAVELIQKHFVPSRDYCYKAGNYHQGSKYLPTRYSAELFAQWIVNKAVGGVQIYSIFHRAVCSMM